MMSRMHSRRQRLGSDDELPPSLEVNIKAALLVESGKFDTQWDRMNESDTRGLSFWPPTATR